MWVTVWRPLLKEGGGVQRLPNEPWLLLVLTLPVKVKVKVKVKKTMPLTVWKRTWQRTNVPVLTVVALAAVGRTRNCSSSGGTGPTDFRLL
jgi:hypothetical protein